MTNHQTRRLASSCGILLGTVLLGTQTSVAYQTPPDTLYLSGIIRDFMSTHPDFDVTDVTTMGHYIGMVEPVLDADGQLVFTGTGLQVTQQWSDQFGNPIVPYAATDPGLPGGHFDVDVYDTPTTSKLDHTHQFDDKYFTTSIDVANDNKLMFKDVIPPGYPNQLNMVFENVHNGGGGTFRFDDGSGLVQGTTSDGFAATFDPNLLVELEVKFVSLSALRSTQPSDSQNDAVDRDDAFRIIMYDSVTSAMVYEVVAYHHDKGEILSDAIAGGSAIVPVGAVDACGVDIIDNPGTFGVTGTAAITDSISFDQWFTDVLGLNQSTRYTVALQRDAMGVYEYMTDSFFPIDNILMGNEGELHNNLFTYKLSASFTYELCSGQFFEFQSWPAPQKLNQSL